MFIYLLFYIYLDGDKFVWLIKKINFDKIKPFNVEIWIRSIKAKRFLKFNLLIRDCQGSPQNNLPLIIFQLRIENQYLDI